MQYRKLGSTELNVSRVSLGTMTFGSQADESTARSMVDQCLEAGVNFVDTANKYNSGRSEEMLGRILKGRREQVVLASKVFGKMGDEPDQSGLSAAAIRRAVDDSLRRLQTDYLDIYYLHQPDYSVPLEETLSAMDQLIQDGKVRYGGASNYASWQIVHALWIAESHGLRPLAVMQPMYNLIARGIEQEFLPMCDQFKLGTAVYNPLAGGLLTGKHTSQEPLPGSRFDGNRQYLDRYWNQRSFAAVQRLKEIAEQAGRSPVEVALRWLMHHSQVDSVILGASRIEHLQQNLSATTQDALPPEAATACDELWTMVCGVVPKYNR